MSARIVASILVSIGIAQAPLAADPFDLDPSFGSGGKVTTQFGGADSANTVALQTDGKIVVAGVTSANGTLDFALARYLTNGALDTTFGNNGLVITDFGFDESAHGVAIQSDGKIVAGGGSDKGAAGWDVVLARYDTSGALDPTFGSGGLVISDALAFDYAYGLALQPDDRILIVGQAVKLTPQLGADSDLLVMRFLANGQPDPSFGTLGVVVTDFAWEYGGTSTDIGRGIGVFDDGRIVVAGSGWGSWYWDQETFYLIGRYLADGSPDPSFDFSSNLEPGKYSGGSAEGYANWFADLALRRADGSDSGRTVFTGLYGLVAWPHAGTVPIQLYAPQNTGNGVAIFNSDRVVRVGEHDSDFGLELYNKDGGLDYLCAQNPVVKTDFAGGFDRANAVAIQPDGKVVVVGSAEFFLPDDFAIARYDGSCSPSSLLIKKLIFISYHKFVHPQDIVGPNWPGSAPIGLARSTQVVLPTAETSREAPFAFKSYELAGTGARSAVDAAGDESRAAAERSTRELSTFLGDFSVVVESSPDYVMLAAGVRTRDAGIDYTRNLNNDGYICRAARSAAAARYRAADPLNPGRFVGLDRITHVCDTLNGSTHSREESLTLLCFNATATDERIRHPLVISDTLGSQPAVVGEPVAGCVDAVEAATLE